MRKFIFLAFSALVLCSCGNEHGRMGIFSAEADVLGIMQDDLFVGQAVGYLDRTGTIELVSTVDQSIRCVGEFRYTGSKTGKGQITCNDGNIADFQFNSLTSLSGYGYGTSSRGGFSFTYGLSPDDASKYLRLPSGKKMERTGKGMRLTEA
jgi:hypothetical protein